MMTRDYLSVKIWDLNMENRPVETYQVKDVCCLGFFNLTYSQMLSNALDKKKIEHAISLYDHQVLVCILSFMF